MTLGVAEVETDRRLATRGARKPPRGFWLCARSTVPQISDLPVLLCPWLAA